MSELRIDFNPLFIHRKRWMKTTCGRGPAVLVILYLGLATPLSVTWSTKDLFAAWFGKYDLGTRNSSFSTYLTLVPHKFLKDHDSQKIVFYHNLSVFFPICKLKELKLFQPLTLFHILLKKIWLVVRNSGFRTHITVHNFSAP